MEDSKRVLDPVERTSEVLFGLIIVLTFTCSLGSGTVHVGEVHALLIGAVGCSLAWGIIDAFFYVLGRLSDRGQDLLFLRRVRKTSDPGEVRQIISSALPPLIAALLHSDEYESLHRELRQLPDPPPRPRFVYDDLWGALAVFLLVFGSMIPIVIPFTFMSDARMALRISNGIAILLMFLAGYGLGRGASDHPWRVGVAMVVLGLAMVGVAKALGG